MESTTLIRCFLSTPIQVVREPPAMQCVLVERRNARRSNAFARYLSEIGCGGKPFGKPVALLSRQSRLAAKDDAEIVLLADTAQPLLGLGGFALAVPHGCVEPVARQQCEMRSALGDHAVLENDDFVGADDRRQAVRDDERRAIAADEVERRLDFMFRRAVER